MCCTLSNLSYRNKGVNFHRSIYRCQQDNEVSVAFVFIGFTYKNKHLISIIKLIDESKEAYVNNDFLAENRSYNLSIVNEISIDV